MSEVVEPVSRCVCCGIQIPIDDSRINNEVKSHVRTLVRQGSVITAIKELKQLANISLSDAKQWVDHCGEPIGKGLITGPCPFCGKELRTIDAKQCRRCKRDWHDPNNVRILGTSEPFVEES